MDTFTISEKIQWIKWYLAGNSLNQVRDLFSAFYQARPIPARGTISRIINLFNETGSVIPLCNKCRGINENVEPNEENRVNENKLNILLCVTENPNKSVRQIAAELNVQPTTVYNVLKKEKYKSYKYSKHQELFEADKMARIEFCENIMNKANLDRNFLKNICFTDESTFTLHGEPNVQNFRYWSKENPHLLINTHSQYPQKVNVWAGIFGQHIIGPFFIEETLNGHKYLNMLENDIGPELEQYSNADSIVWYQHDGCPAHSTHETKLYLDQCFPNAWIGRRGPIHWPARSPDLAPCDFFLWPYLKENLYKNSYDNINELKNAIVEECNNVTFRQLSHVRREFYDRLGYCLAVDGDLFEHLI